jgi:hypothetical protein
MSQIFTIVEDTVVIDKLALTNTAGIVVHSGSISVTNVINTDTLNADTINVKNLVTDNGGLASIGEWKYDTEVELNGKGFTWSWENNDTKLIFRTGNRLWTNANLDLSSDAVYSIGDTPVLTAKSLGDSVVNSSLTSVGTLTSLEVSGDVTLSDFAFFSSVYNRFGIGTDEPNAALSISENNVEIIVGSPATNSAFFGAYTSSDVSIVTDNIPRITAKADGEVHIGNEFSKTGVLRVFGTLYADAIQTDNRVTRTHPLEFKATVDTTSYGLGLVWTGTGETRQMTLLADVAGDKIWLNENFEISENKNFIINGKAVLSESALGASVTSSRLTSVGTLSTLAVSGDVTIGGNVSLDTITANTVTFGNVTFNQNGLSSTDTLHFTAHDSKVFYADESQISIGDPYRNNKQVKVFGPLSVGINNPDPDVNFSVSGDVKIGGKKFTNGLNAPSTGTFEIGDICWNTRPQATSYVGWVCVAAGDPGEWLPFGGINTQL